MRVVALSRTSLASAWSTANPNSPSLDPMGGAQISVGNAVGEGAIAGVWRFVVRLVGSRLKYERGEALGIAMGGDNSRKYFVKRNAFCFQSRRAFQSR